CTNEFIPEKTDTDFQIFIMDDAVKPVKKDKRYSYDDTGNAERLKDKFGSFIRYNYTAKNWMYYDGKRWKNDDAGKMKGLVDKVIAGLKSEKISDSYEGYD
ncbi:DNA primase, partial [Staphylococcus aureus]